MGMGRVAGLPIWRKQAPHRKNERKSLVSSWGMRTNLIKLPQAINMEHKAILTRIKSRKKAGAGRQGGFPPVV